MEIALELYNVVVYDGLPTILLKESGGRRCCRLVTDDYTAEVIIRAKLGGKRSINDIYGFAEKLMQHSGLSLERVVLTGFKDQLVLAKAHFSQGQKKFSLPFYTDESIALAMRNGKTIFIEEETLQMMTPDGEVVYRYFREREQWTPEQIAQFDKAMDTIESSDEPTDKKKRN